MILAQKEHIQVLKVHCLHLLAPHVWLENFLQYKEHHLLLNAKTVHLVQPTIVAQADQFALLVHQKHVHQLFTRSTAHSLQTVIASLAQNILANLALHHQTLTSPACQTLPAPGCATLAIT